MPDGPIVNWWEADEAAVAGDRDLAAARRVAYYSVFYATAMGRQVLADLRRLAGGGVWAKASIMGLSADEFLVLSSLMGKIKDNAGASAEMDCILAEGRAAAAGLHALDGQEQKPKEANELEID